ncbi:MAG: NAD(P)H-dependent oxidoreductase [Spirochaetaceae bacterium]|nr:NAD(P)H-dependent oxidoreductase [Spirochaetaceae bacterium]MCF7948994.1 NAD(P)H-dependent oxidoreductase [Spirochaetia bacterium]MCF7952035.1 NAD(P)H-dependent oxidoreductase [Spirochaetaceae bacterium]
MNTIILNGSPKGNPKQSNSRIFAEHFVKEMRNPCEIKRIAENDSKELARYAAGFDTIIIILPLYIHAMPGLVMKFIEKLEPAPPTPATPSGPKTIGFIIQAGFMETAQHKYVEPYFRRLAEQLNYTYLGTVSKGEAAGIYMYPKMFKKVLKLISELGVAYEKTRAFDKEIVKKLSKPYQLSSFQLRLLKVVDIVGLSNIGWHKVLKQNGAFEQRLDRPFI